MCFIDHQTLNLQYYNRSLCCFAFISLNFDFKKKEKEKKKGRDCAIRSHHIQFLKVYMVGLLLCISFCGLCLSHLSYKLMNKAKIKLHC